jgi:hypothetical protein
LHHIFFYEGPDYINLVNTWSLHLDGYYTGNETQPSSVTYGYLENKVTNIPSSTTNFTFQSSENFTGTVVYNCPGNVLMSSSKNNIPIGINDYISLENPPLVLEFQIIHITLIWAIKYIILIASFMMLMNIPL